MQEKKHHKPRTEKHNSLHGACGHFWRDHTLEVAVRMGSIVKPYWKCPEHDPEPVLNDET